MSEQEQEQQQEQQQSNQQILTLAAIGDLEVTRRQLIMEIQARDRRIAELEAQLNGSGIEVVSAIPDLDQARG